VQFIRLARFAGFQWFDGIAGGCVGQTTDPQALKQ
jgi:hypothetical protein